MAFSPIIFMANKWGKDGNGQILFSWAPKPLQTMTAAMKLKDACSWKKSNDIPIESIKKQRHYFAYKGHVTKTMVFPVVMY